MPDFLPVVVLAFANDRADSARYLRNLPEEQRRIRAALQPAVDAGLCELVERSNVTLGELLDLFQEPRLRHRVAILHFGGHAGDAELLLETREGAPDLAHAEGLAAFLGAQRSLELVFLNGCSTGAQVERLLDGGVGAVIATARAIEDSLAADLATRFYRGLAGGSPIRAAWEEAVAALRAQQGETRACYRSFDMPEASPDRWPWELHVRSGADLSATWSIPLAAGDPLFGLPAPPPSDLPARPFTHLNWFTRDQAEVFFGRGRAISELYQAVTTPAGAPIVLLFGGTGVGKSSLLHAGLLPRVTGSHTVHYLRRQRGPGLTGTVAAALGCAAEPAAIAAAWRAAERERPLLVVVDQVEEAYTRPHARGEEWELEQALEALRILFAARERRPRGRLVLGFRKEWLAEILRSLKEHKLPRLLVELEHLDREGVIEAVRGPASSERLRQAYGLELEEGLAEIIADDLLEDHDAAVAPALQVLLTKLWDRAVAAEPARPRFTIELYQSLKKQGILLGDFVEQAIAQLQRWSGEAVGTGLALDVLALHTTPLGTAEARDAVALLDAYGRRPGLIELIQQCKDAYLLAGDARRLGDGLAGTTRLAHDTLAPIVRRRFEESDHPGQRAARILIQRTRDWEGERPGNPLDEADLAIVEEGRAGMRAWTEVEQRLVEASRARRAQRCSRRRQLVSLAVLAVLAIVCSAGFAWIKRGEAEAAAEEARDARLAAEAAADAAQDAKRRADADRRRAEEEEARAEGALADVEAERRTVERLHNLSLARQLLRFCEEALAEQRHERAALLWKQAERCVTDVAPGELPLELDAGLRRVLDDPYACTVWHEPATFQAESFAPQSDGLALSADGRLLASLRHDGVHLWDLESAQREPRPVPFEETLCALAIRADGGRMAVGTDKGAVLLWDPAEGIRRLGSVAAGEAGWEQHVSALAFETRGPGLVAASADGQVARWSDIGQAKAPPARLAEQAPVQALAMAQGRVVLGDQDGRIRLWAGDALQEIRLEEEPSPFGFAEEGERQPTWVGFDAEGRALAAQGSRVGFLLWREGGETAGFSPIVLGQTLNKRLTPVERMAFSPDGRWLLTQRREARKSLLWDLEGETQQRPLALPSTYLVAQTVARDAERVVDFNGKALRVWERREPWSRLIRTPGTLLRVATDGTLLGKDPDERGLWRLSGDRSATPRAWGGYPSTGSPEPLLGPWGRWMIAHDDGAGLFLFQAGEDGFEDAALAQLPGPEGANQLMSFDLGSRHWIGAGYVDGYFRFWRRDALDAPLDLRYPERLPNHLEFSADEGLVGMLLSDALALWRLTPDELVPVGRFRGSSQDGGVSCVALGPHSRQWAVGLDSGRIRVWRAEPEPTLLLDLRAHARTVDALGFAPDGQRLASAGQDGEVRLWSLAPPEEAPRIALPLEAWGLTFLPDGQRLLVNTEEGLRVLELSGQALEARLRGRARRNLSRAEWARFLGKDEPYRKTWDHLDAAPEPIVEPERRLSPAEEAAAALGERWLSLLAEDDVEAALALSGIPFHGLGERPAPTLNTLGERLEQLGQNLRRLILGGPLRLDGVEVEPADRQRVTKRLGPACADWIPVRLIFEGQPLLILVKPGDDGAAGRVRGLLLP